MESTIKPANDTETLDWIMTHLGPDTFSVQTEGAERLMTTEPTDYLGNCDYAFRFQLNNGDRLWLSVMHTFEDYNGFREVIAPRFSDPKPPVLQEQVLQQPTELDLCGNRCTTHLAPGPETFLALPSLSASAQATKDRAALPSCKNATLSGTLDGGYFQTNAYDMLHPAHKIPVSRHGRTTAGYTGFVPFGCEWRHHGTRFADHASCIQNKRNILFIGDSHARSMYDLLRHRLENKHEVIPVSEQALRKNSTFGKVKLEYMWDAFMERNNLDCSMLDTFDSFVIATGTHALARHCLTVPEWKEELDRIMAIWNHSLTHCGSARPPPKLIFLNIPAFTERDYYHDCRTGPRTAYWNRIAGDTFRANGWQVVDIEKYTKPVADDLQHMDSVHYTSLDAIEPMGDDLIERLELCESD